jgi:phosphoribosylaminoimidazole-succinocarboxamide synthase
MLNEIMSEVLTETDFDFLGTKKTGKVRDIYEQPDRLVLISTDRHSSFDRHIADVPHKGQVLNQASAWWFKHTEDIVPNHVIAVPDPSVTVARKCKLIPVEAVMRGYLTGVTDTAIWTRYQNGQREFGGVMLPEGMRKNQKLPEAIFDPTTKEADHDRALSLSELVGEGFITAELFEEIKGIAKKLFARGQSLAEGRGLILVDTKYEFGLDQGGNVVLIDEIHTPDSSRWWKLDSYDSRMSEGKEPEYFDKEFLRLWFKEHSDPYKDATLPQAPAELISELSRRYVEMYEQMTGQTFVPGEEPIAPRIEKNLKAYAA